MSDRSNLIETIATQDKFSTFARLLKSSGTTEVFTGEGDFTVFAPTNDAFAKIPEARMNELLSEPGQAKLKSLLSYHIVQGKVMAANLSSAPTRKALTGTELTFADLNGLKVNGASVQARNIEATNGVIHAVDTVLQPSSSATAVAASTAAAGASGSTLFTPVTNTQDPIAPAATTPASPGANLSAAVPPTASAVPSKTDEKPLV